MSYIFSLIAGIIQGLTEFLPISSSGHLLFFHNLFGFDFIDNLTFDVVLHLGTLAALLAFFWSDARRYLAAFFKSFSNWKLKEDSDQRLAWCILAAAIPALFFGYLFDKYWQDYFRSITMTAGMMIIFGVILYLADRFSKKELDLSQLNWKDSIIIGFWQILALIPGVSRSGITIIAGLGQGLKRAEAAKFSFLVSMPVIFAAGVKKIFDLFTSSEKVYLSGSDYLALLVGFLASMITGFLCIKYLLKFLQNHSLNIFVYYRIFVGLIVLTLLFINIR